MKKLPIQDFEMAYVDRGAGVAVLLVHGFPLDHTMWNAQIEALAARYRVIAPDLRGFGESTLGNVSAETGSSMREYADDLAALLDALAIDEPVVFAGFSMGGYIAWQFVEHYGERLRGLVLSDTRAADDDDEARAGRLKMADHVAEWGAGRVAELMGPKLFAAASFENLPDVVEEVRQVVSRTSPAAIAAAQRGMAARPDVTGQLPRISVPTLVVVGAEDAISAPAEMRRIAEAIPEAEFVEIAAAGHMAPLENAPAVNEAFGRFVDHLTGQ